MARTWKDALSSLQALHQSICSGSCFSTTFYCNTYHLNLNLDLLAQLSFYNVIYGNHPNTGHPNTENVQKLDFLLSVNQMVESSLISFSPTIQKSAFRCPFLDFVTTQSKLPMMCVFNQCFNKYMECIIHKLYKICFPNFTST